MAIAGAVYGRLFGRAANNSRGGWLFGMAFGFALWAGGAVLVLPLLSGGRSPAGMAALGVALSMLVWGVTIGILAALRPPAAARRASRTGVAAKPQVGPDAAAGKKQPVQRAPPGSQD